MPELRTLTEIADELQVPRPSVDYITRSRRIRERKRVGSTRLYDDATVREIREALTLSQSSGRGRPRG